MLKSKVTKIMLLGGVVFFIGGCQEEPLDEFRAGGTAQGSPEITSDPETGVENDEAILIESE